jgi:hypothetical protein
MDMVETEFLEQQEIKPWVWLRYIDDIFFVWLEGEDKLLQFMKRLNAFHPGLKFTYEYSQTKVNFLDVSVGIDAGRFITSLPIAINIYIMSHHTLRTLKVLSYIVRVCASRKFARVKRILKTLTGTVELA